MAESEKRVRHSSIARTLWLCHKPFTRRHRHGQFSSHTLPKLLGLVDSFRDREEELDIHIRSKSGPQQVRLYDSAGNGSAHGVHGMG